MSVIEGNGVILEAGVIMETTGPRMYVSTGVPANGAAGTGLYAGIASNGALCKDVTTDHVYENQELVADETNWVRIDTVPA